MHTDTTMSATVTPSGIFRRETFWKKITDFTMYPTLIPLVKNVEILERDGTGSGVSSWFIIVDDAPFTWIQKESFNAAQYCVDFDAIDGDFDTFHGSWTTDYDVHDGVSVTLSLQYHLGIPVIEEVIGHLLRARMEKYLRETVAALTSAAEHGQADERQLLRIPVGKFMGNPFGEGSGGIHIINLSRGGILFHALEKIVEPVEAIQLHDEPLPCSLVEFDGQSRLGRLCFTPHIEPKQFAAILDRLHAKSKQPQIGTILHEQQQSAYTEN